MAQYFRIKEITAPATVLRQGNLLNIELGDFIYPDEVSTLVCANTVVYWNDNTGEHYTIEPGVVAVAPAAPVPQVPETPETPETPEVPAKVVVPAPLESGSEDTKA